MLAIAPRQPRSLLDRFPLHDRLHTTRSVNERTLVRSDIVGEIAEMQAQYLDLSQGSSSNITEMAVHKCARQTLGIGELRALTRDLDFVDGRRITPRGHLNLRRQSAQCK